jgi:hypothetical protein
MLDFPNSPSVGQIYPTPAVAGVPQWRWDGSEWAPLFAGSIAPLSCKVRTFTSGATYVPTTGTQFVVVETVGGGAGGGGCAGVATANSFNGGGGGGGGAYARVTLTAAQIGASQLITIGAAGAGGTAGANNGGNGGTTSFGSFCIASGGGGGTGVNGISNFGQGSNGGGSGTGDLVLGGMPGGGCMYTAGTAMGIYACTNNGGNGGNGGAGGRTLMPGAGATSNGSNASSFGGGGSGAAFAAVAANAAGGAGAQGICIVTEYGFFGSTLVAIPAVQYDVPQNLTVNQQAQARANIGLAKKNYVINGGMTINQENAGGAAVSGSGGCPVDQFQMLQATTTAVHASNQQGGSPTASGSWRLSVAITTADAAMTSNKYIGIWHKLEGQRVADLRYGTALAKTITLSFVVNTTLAGIYCVALRNPAGRTYVQEYNVLLANVDQLVTLTFPGDVTAPAWPTDNTEGMEVVWALMAGPTVQTTANVWNSSGTLATANQVNLAASTNTFYLSDVGLYEGTSAPAFTVPDFASELQACMRYWEKTFLYSFKPASPGDGQSAAVGVSVTTLANANVIPWFFKARKRIATGATTTYNPYVAGSGISSSGSGNYSVQVYQSGENGLTVRDAAGGITVGSNIAINATVNARM